MLQENRPEPVVLPRRSLTPWWLALAVFVPLQIWLFLKMRDAWGIWPTIGTFAVLGFVAARAARPRGILAWLLPWRAERKNASRPAWLALLVAAVALAWFAPFGPQPWLPLLGGVLTLKAVVA